MLPLGFEVLVDPAEWLVDLRAVGVGQAAHFVDNVVEQLVDADATWLVHVHLVEHDVRVFQFDRDYGIAVDRLQALQFVLLLVDDTADDVKSAWISWSRTFWNWFR